MDGSVLFGLETEYGFTPLGPDGAVLDRETAAGGLLRRVRKRVPHLPDVSGLGIFLANGSRIYNDRGPHPEVSTPECTRPSEIVRHARAGEALLAAGARDLEEEIPGARILLTSSNMDYGSGDTWGCHESYLHRADRVRMFRELLPHLVTRIVYTGAGGFRNQGPSSDFLISPRACQLRRTLGRERWFTSKPDEPLGVGFTRLHVVCGESLRSALGTRLKVGATALVVRLIERGLCHGGAVKLRDPVVAMLRIAADPSCRRKVGMAGGRSLDAIEIQEHYLRAVRAQLGQRFMPAWAEALCAEWGDMLERLRGAPDSVATTLDWAIKYAVFRRHSERYRDRERCDRTLDLFPEETRRVVRSELSRPGPGLRAELRELDVRFGQLGPLGIFRNLEAAGVLSQEFSGSLFERPPPGLLPRPPRVGRAWRRGHLVAELASQPGYLCDWEGVINRRNATFADLRDPYQTRIRWRPLQEGSREWIEDRLVHSVLRQARSIMGNGSPG